MSNKKTMSHEQLIRKLAIAYEDNASMEDMAKMYGSTIVEDEGELFELEWDGSLSLAKMYMPKVKIDLNDGFYVEDNSVWAYIYGYENVWKRYNIGEKVRFRARLDRSIYPSLPFSVSIYPPRKKIGISFFLAQAEPLDKRGCEQSAAITEQACREQMLETSLSHDWQKHWDSFIDIINYFNSKKTGDSMSRKHFNHKVVEWEGVVDGIDLSGMYRNNSAFVIMPATEISLKGKTYGQAVGLRVLFSDEELSWDGVAKGDRVRFRGNIEINSFYPFLEIGFYNIEDNPGELLSTFGVANAVNLGKVTNEQQEDNNL